MKTIIYVNNNKYNRKNNLSDLIIGILLLVISLTGLFMNSKLILKVFMYIIPMALFLYSISIYKIAFSLRKTDVKHFVIFLIQGIILTLGSIYIILFPIESLNYIVIFIGIIIIINSINNMILNNLRSIGFIPFLLGILLILFSDQIIDTFYTLLLIILLFVGASKLIKYFYK